MNWHSEESCTPHRKKKKACCYLSFPNKEQELGKQELHSVYLCERLGGFLSLSQTKWFDNNGMKLPQKCVQSPLTFSSWTLQKNELTFRLRVAYLPWDGQLLHSSLHSDALEITRKKVSRPLSNARLSTKLSRPCLVFFLGEPDAGKKLCGPKHKFKARAIRFSNGDYFDTPVFHKTKPK